jgi:hypothetical protein
MRIKELKRKIKKIGYWKFLWKILFWKFLWKILLLPLAYAGLIIHLFGGLIIALFLLLAGDFREAKKMIKLIIEFG